MCGVIKLNLWLIPNCQSIRYKVSSDPLNGNYLKNIEVLYAD